MSNFGVLKKRFVSSNTCFYGLFKMFVIEMKSNQDFQPFLYSRIFTEMRQAKPFASLFLTKLKGGFK
ncbi:MAG: hypothetical protein KKF68_02850 [Nanoarchaeota archaeon]|nr:hypothetical protein [Nanoarchaeota archaeon]